MRWFPFNPGRAVLGDLTGSEGALPGPLSAPGTGIEAQVSW